MKREEHTYAQSIISPQATYSPWLDDKEFLSFYNKVKGNTLVDIYRCFELWSLVKQVSPLKGDFLEIGVWRGGSGCIISKMANLTSPKSKIYLCDTFEGIVKASEKHDNMYRGGELDNTSDQIVKDLVLSLNLNNTEVRKGMFPDDTSADLVNSQFKFCHIDVDVYEGAKEITEWVWPRLAKHGMIIYDDFGFKNTQGVTKYVLSMMKETDRVVFQNINGHAVVIKY
jgi:hypothetical protein|tara:strand:- start:8889 stop:9569 length:681 start_codon:yes stop_codon:yes gene_type:complete